MLLKSKIKIRRAKITDIPQILEIEKEAWGREKAASKEMLESRIKTFPEGTLVAEVNKKIVGIVATEKIDYDIEGDNRSWYEITDDGFIKKTHNPKGNTIYGVDLSVKPSFQHKRVGTKLLEAIGKLVISYNAKQGILGGRLPGYHKYADKMSVEEYVQSSINTENGERYLDPEVDFYKKRGLKLVRIIPNYFKDPESLNYGLLLLWKNPFYNKWYRWIIAKFFRAP